MDKNKEPALRQLDLFSSPRADDALRAILEKAAGKPVLLTLTDNSTTMLSVRKQGNAIRARLHRMFLDAPAPVIDEISAFLRSRKSGMPLFRRFIRENRERIRSRPPKRVVVRTVGKYHDLAALFREINEEYFGGSITASITWGTKRPRLAVKKRTLGSYSERAGLIRINPALDKRSVPKFFVAFIIYHEMLHAALGTPLLNKKRSVHSREFRAREKLFKDYGRAITWERAGT
jgi:hypothetical protein